MKTVKIFKTLVCAFLISVLLFSSFSVTAKAASGYEIGGNLSEKVSWVFETKSGKLTVSGSGKAVSESQWQNSYPWSDFAHNIKSVEFENGITEIGAFAFTGAKKLKKVIATNSVKKVGAYAFDNTKWLSRQKNGGVYIGRCLYAWKGTVSGGSPSFKSNTYSISDYAFSSNDTLTSVTIPSSVRYIGNNAFIWCEKLKSVTFKKGTTTIGSSCFSNCTSLSSVTLPSTLKKIPTFAFEKCTALKQITLPARVYSVSPHAFYACKNLTTVNLSKNLKKLYATTFQECYNLKNVNVSQGSKYLYKDKNGVIYNLKKTKLYFMPLGRRLKTYKVNSKTTEICEAAFYESTSLTKITLPKKLKTIGVAAFGECTKLKTINAPSGVSKMDNSGIKDTLWYQNKPSGIIYFGKVLLDYKGTMYSDSWLQIKEGTVSVASYAFMGREELSKVTFPSTLTRIGDHAFALCTSLKSVYLPPSVTYIGQSAFQDCTSFGDITVSNPLCTIDTTYNLVFPGNATVICHKYSTAFYAVQNSNCSTRILSDINIGELDISVNSEAKLKNGYAKPKIKVSYYGKTLKNNVHYTVTYLNNTRKGTAQVIIRGNNNSSCFTGSVSYSFTVT